MKTFEPETKSDLPTPGDEMRIASIRRFERAEIALHWSLVVPYLALALSGFTMLLGRATRSEWLLASRPRLLVLHQAAALALAVLPVAVMVVTAPGPIWRSAREALRFGLRDLWWLHASPLKIFFPRVRLPPEGRFNAGQKLNVLHVLLLVPFVAGTGALLWWWAPSALLVRVAHVGAASASLLLASGHMYLALIHPTTRVARGAMVHGLVPASYAAHHHPAWYAERVGQLPPAASKPLAPRVAWRPLLAALGALLLILGASFALPRVPGVKDRASRSLASFLEEPRSPLLPASLHPAHDGRADLVRCRACHGSGLEDVDDRSCLGCHEEVERRLAGDIGYHGKLRGACASCHADHRSRLIELEDTSFQHAQATFALRGAHQSVACDDCHRRDGERRSYLGVEHEACRSCHEDPHVPSLGASCESCHAETAWSAIAPGFSHDRDTDFVLRGRHAAVACAGCHRREVGVRGPPALRGLDASCASCHQDPHTPTLGSSCDRCHSEEDWRSVGGRFDHDRDSAFPLLGTHRTVACRACHTAKGTSVGDASRLRGTPSDCRSCHEDPHARPDIDCAACHAVETGWRGSRFDHARDARFALDPRHASLACVTCHRSNAPPSATDVEPPELGSVSLVFRQALDDDEATRRFACAGCHEDVSAAFEGRVGLTLTRVEPSVHRGETACAECHREDSIPPAARAAPCSACHPRDHDVLFVDWQRRIELQLLDQSAADAALLRRQGYHHWEGVVKFLERR